MNTLTHPQKHVGPIGPEPAALGANPGLCPGSATESSFLLRMNLTARSLFSLNRVTWRPYEGDMVALGAFGPLEDPLEDSVAYFSESGPTPLGVPKP